MGWWGHYIGFTPKGQERIKYVIEEEGYDTEDERHIWKPIATALVGSVVYLAIERTEKTTGEKVVYAEVCLTRMDRGYMMVKAMSDTMGPGYYDCPKRILDLLTPTDSEWANEWRKLCEEKRAQKKPDDLAKLPEGTMIEINGFGGMWMIDKRKNRKVAINYGIMKYLPFSMVRKYGWNRK